LRDEFVRDSTKKNDVHDIHTSIQDSATQGNHQHEVIDPIGETKLNFIEKKGIQLIDSLFFV
jgi:hypothetical protein